ncbi:MAG: hypothetical protein KME29_13300 [Calothrix sp. FI2-JRJ7]|jgi:hypothetical protein|nr:hypothetical protein [Calothrix sp. FI2-JRJ7]
MNASAPIFQAFNYFQFESQDLIAKAQETWGNFKIFVRQTFDALIETGRALQNLYDECLNIGTNSKKVFFQWLDSFGASRYIARAAMDLYNWFKDLDPRIQELIRENVQSWKVSALRQLRHLTTELLKEIVTSGKKTAAQVKQLIARDSKNLIKTNGTTYQDNDPDDTVPAQNNGTESISEVEPTKSNCVPELAPGMRVVVNSNDAWNGSAGIIMSIHKDSEFWVLLDHTVSQGMEIKDLLKSEQLVPEVKRVVTVSEPAVEAHGTLDLRTRRAPTTNKTYSEAELEARIAEALATKEREIAELEQARYTEIRNAALEAAKREIIAAEQHARYMTQQKEQLTAQLYQATEEIHRLRALEVKNKQLEQRVSDLEKALEGANRDSWNNTLNKQAAKVLNSQVEKTVVLLTKKVDLLQNLNAELKQELADLDAFSSQQQQELDNYRRLFESNHQTSETQTQYICSV